MSNYRRNEIWENIPGMGELYIEELLVVGEEPILFVCRDMRTIDRYLIMTYDSDEGVYVISKISPGILCSMLENKIPMDKAFRSTDKILCTQKNEDFLQYSEYASDEFDAEMLPKKNAMFDIKLNYIDRYIDALRQEPQFIFDYELQDSIGENEFVYDPGTDREQYIVDSPIAVLAA